MSCIDKVLSIDKTFRYNGVIDDLYNIDSLGCKVLHEIEEPILVQNTDKCKPTIIKSQDDFNKLFYEKNKILQKLNFTNIIVAGGAIRNVLLQETELSNDIDIFLYGITNVIDANNKVDEIIKHILEITKITNDYTAISVTNHVINIGISDNIKIQIIMRLYSSVSEVLHGFDLGSSAVGFDGKHTYFTTLSKFSYENMVNIIDTTRRSTSYEYRLIKYFNYGFDIVIPNLDIECLPSETKRIKLKYLPFEYTKIEKNKITINTFDKIFNKISDYDIFEPINNKSYNNRRLLHVNFYRIINNKSQIYFIRTHHTSKGIYVENMLDQTVAFIDEISVNDIHKYGITENNIKDFYIILKWNYSKNRLTVDHIKRYFTIVNPKDIIENIYFSDMTDDQKKIYMKKLIKQQTISTIKLVKKYIEHPYVPEWIITNPMTQMSGSFNPIIEESWKWYGIENYKF
jgi:hypothetical protein